MYCSYNETVSVICGPRMIVFLAQTLEAFISLTSLLDWQFYLYHSNVTANCSDITATGRCMRVISKLFDLYFGDIYEKRIISQLEMYSNLG